MAATVELPGVGVLTPEQGPGGLSMWSTDCPTLPVLVEAGFSESVSLHIILDGTEELGQVDLAFVAEVFNDLDRYLVAALRFTHRKLLADPVWFGLTGDDLGPYRDFRIETFPLDAPALVFYAGREWLIHFQEGRFPVCEPMGLQVIFDRQHPVRLDDLRDSESIT